VAAPLTRRAASLAGGLLAGGFLLALAFTGGAPQLGSLVRFEPGGVMARPPEEITRVELRDGQEALVFTRADADRWRRGDAALSDAAAEHVTRALRFLHVSKPVATLAGDAFETAALAAMGLAPAGSEVAVFAGDQRALAIAFGGPNPSGTGQYARLEGQSGIWLLPLHVGREWQLVAHALPDHRAVADRSRSP